MKITNESFAVVRPQTDTTRIQVALSVPAKTEFAHVNADGNGVGLTFGQVVRWLQFLQLTGHCRVDLHLKRAV